MTSQPESYDKVFGVGTAGYSSGPTSGSGFQGNRQLDGVRVTVHRGKVKNADFMGKSDPYVVLTLDGVKRQTGVLDNTLEPEWNETLELPVMSANPILHVEAFDKDKDADDALGEGTFDLSQLQNDADGVIRNVRVPLILKNKNEGFIEMSFASNWKVAQDTAASAAAAQNFRSMLLTIESGRGFTKGDILSKPDPYVVVHTLPNGANDTFKTSVQKNTAEPNWGESHEFDIQGESEFKMEVWDKDRLTKDDLLGEIQVPFQELGLHKGPGQRWIPVFRKQKSAGEILIRYAPQTGPKGSNAAPPLLPPPIAPAYTPPPPAARFPPPQRLRVTCVEGRDIKGKDLIGKADPYCEVRCGPEQFKTKVDKVPNPIWGDSHVFDFSRGAPADVEFDVMDRDRFSKDDHLGRAVVPVTSIGQPETRSIPIYKKDGSPNGHIMVHFEPINDRPTDALMPYPPAPYPGVGGGRQLSALTVTVKEAKDLPTEAGLKGKMGKVDPYVIVSTNKDNWQTSTKKNTHNPTWDESYTFDMHGQSQLRFEVMDKDKLTRDDPLCHTTLNLADLPLHQTPPICRWLPMQKHKGTGDAGQLFVCFTPKYEGAPTVYPTQPLQPYFPTPYPSQPTQPFQPMAPGFGGGGLAYPPQAAQPQYGPMGYYGGAFPPPPSNYDRSGKRMQMEELRRQIEDQRRRNEDLRRFHDMETNRLRNELADQRGTLHQSLGDIRQEVTRRDRLSQAGTPPHGSGTYPPAVSPAPALPPFPSIARPASPGSFGSPSAFLPSSSIPLSASSFSRPSLGPMRSIPYTGPSYAYPYSSDLPPMPSYSAASMPAMFSSNIPPVVVEEPMYVYSAEHGGYVPGY